MQQASRGEVAAEVLAALLAGREASVPELGTFTIRDYPAYEARDPRTGEPASIPAKRRVAFVQDVATRRDPSTDEQGPQAAWIAALFEELRSGARGLFGRLGTFKLRQKEAKAVKVSDTGAKVRIHARVTLMFRNSRFLTRAVERGEHVESVDPAALDQVFARLPARPPQTIAELDAELARLGIDPGTSGILPPANREVDDTGKVRLTGDGVSPRYLEGNLVVQGGQRNRVEIAVDRWAAGMLVIAAVRDVARDAVLDVADVERVLARLGPDNPFSLDELPY